MCLCADATEVAAAGASRRTEAAGDHSADSPLHLAAAESATADCSWGPPLPKDSNTEFTYIYNYYKISSTIYS